jgi:hypothetical protein
MAVCSRLIILPIATAASSIPPKWGYLYRPHWAIWGLFEPAQRVPIHNRAPSARATHHCVCLCASMWPGLVRTRREQIVAYSAAGVATRLAKIRVRRDETCRDEVRGGVLGVTPLPSLRRRADEDDRGARV